MIAILIFIFGLLTAFGLFRIAQAALCLLSGRAVEAVRNIHGKRGVAEQMQNVLMPLVKMLTVLVPMSEYKTKRMEADFSRLNMAQTPQEYCATLMAKSLLLTVVGLMFIPLGVPWLFLVVTVAAMLSYFQGMQSIRKKVVVQNCAIEAELPCLVETLNYSLHENRDLLKFFEKYRKVAGKVFRPELDRLIIELKTGNQETALRRMHARLGIPSFSALIAILCGVHQGVDERVSLLVLEQDLRTKERETLRRSMEKCPARIKAASFILTVLMILMFMIPFVLLIVSSLQAVGF
jgi:hypothetical protein